MSQFIIKDIKESIADFMESESEQVSIAIDFNETHFIGDVVDEDNVGNFYQLKKIEMADTFLLACVRYGGTNGLAFLYDIDVNYWEDADEMIDDLVKNIKYSNAWYDGLIAVELEQF